MDAPAAPCPPPPRAYLLEKSGRERDILLLVPPGVVDESTRQRLHNLEWTLPGSRKEVWLTIEESADPEHHPRFVRSRLMNRRWEWLGSLVLLLGLALCVIGFGTVIHWFGLGP